MNSYLKYCPKCLANFLDSGDYNFTIKKLLLSSQTQTIQNIYSILSYALEERTYQIKLDESHPDYNNESQLLMYLFSFFFIILVKYLKKILLMTTFVKLLLVMLNK